MNSAEKVVPHRILVSEMSDYNIARAYIRKISNASGLGTEFSLSFAQFKRLYKTKKCPVFGMPLMKTLGEPSQLDDEITIDRIDAALGYVPGNCRAISGKANFLKANFENPLTGLNLNDHAKLFAWLNKVRPAK